MAKKKVVRKKKQAGVNKSKEILDYMKRHPADPPRKVAEALSANGVLVTAQYVSTIKANQKLRQGPTVETVAAATTQPKAVAPSKVRGGSVSLDSLMHLKQVAEEFGGIENTIRALDAIKQLR